MLIPFCSLISNIYYRGMHFEICIGNLFMKHLFYVSFLIIGSLSTRAQVVDSTVMTTTVNVPSASTTPEHVYNIKTGFDIPATIILDGYSIYGMSKIYGRDATPASEILALNTNNINKFDRSVANNYSTKAKDLSDKFFYGSMPLPLILLFGHMHITPMYRLKQEEGVALKTPFLQVIRQ